MTPVETRDTPADPAAPVDDGAAAHLTGQRLPALALRGTDGGWVDLTLLPGRTVIYAHPRISDPALGIPEAWNALPGARGCTAQSCAWRDHALELAALHCRVYGLSTRESAEQRAAVARLHLPFPLLSDCCRAFSEALGLPMFAFQDEILLKRLTFIARDGSIEKVFYPVFPPEADAERVIAWLRDHPAS